MQAPAPLYVYTPLWPAGSTFRIVSVLPGTAYEAIQCYFLEVPTSAKPSYSALSYAWGNPETTAFIWVGDKVIGIADNLEHALKRLRCSKQIRNFWIDALCINQADDGEKSMQIPLMRRIYQQSSVVTIYLGKTQDDSDSVPALCERITRAYDRHRMRAPQMTYADSDLNADSYRGLGLPEVGDGQWEIFERFLGRPWFTRVWIIQEAALATSAEVVCGEWTMEWSHLFRTIVGATALGVPGIQDRATHGAANPVMSASQLIFLDALRAGDLEFTPWKCIDLLHRGRVSLASKPHDYCYGLLGMAEECDAPELKPDYLLPVHTVYCQFAKYFVSRGDGIKVLYNASGHGLALPSWVPDWSYRQLAYPRIVPHPQTEPDPHPSCAAASSFSPSVGLHPHASNILVVRGLRFDQVDVLGVVHRSHLTADCERDQRAFARIQHKLGGALSTAGKDANADGWKTGLGPSALLISDAIVEICHLLRTRDSVAYPSGEADEAVVWKTLICNFAKGSMNKAPSHYAKYYRALLLMIMAHDPSWRVPHEFHPEPFDAMEMVRHGAGEVAKWGHVIIQAASQLCHSRRRGKTGRGYVGQFPLQARVGDVVFLPLGSAVPFLIRSGPNGTYELIGECYVHGIMQGEAFSVAAPDCEDVHIA